LSTRDEFVGDDDYVFCCSRLGRALDGSAVPRRYQAAAAAAGRLPKCSISLPGVLPRPRRWGTPGSDSISR
jgi:hypothetical protein